MRKIKVGKQSPATITDFVIEGEGEFNPSKLPSSVRKGIATLDGLPNGILLKKRALATRAGLSERMITDVTTHPALAEFRFVHGRLYLYGNKATIQAARQKYAP